MKSVILMDGAFCPILEASLDLKLRTTSISLASTVDTQVRRSHDQ